MKVSKRARWAEHFRRRYEEHWKSALYLQIAAYVVMLFLWSYPIPNPVKALAVTFHELSHGLAAIATGGRVFGFALSPEGGGVTFGIGGNFFFILAAGYLGSSLFGAAIYDISVQWRSVACLVALELFLLATAALGWLNGYTAAFGFFSIMVMTALFWMPEVIQSFFVRLVGSACCFHAPIEVLADVIRSGRAPYVLGAATPSDLSRLSEILAIPSWILGTAIMAVQFALLAYLVRWSCQASARAEVAREKQALLARRKRILELRRFTKLSWYR